ncbi:DUF3035 domain-containing protein [Rhodovulum sp. MB263]|uniref:DUF3035 domain-containing protein n=1 Tax=Rhodovulum sp. (strain MB263) TaxID=308754 RepID=UPI0009B766F5|nr:DUF3035 domain-containing protein [Rhodovulum sp. MB263]ARC87412.1 pyruvate/2-oxoglutarate dehydrogenase complex, dihydrolipoamide acyltransferase (E2) component [Rhodovulum sp. MB263]
MRSARILVLGVAVTAALSGCSRGDDYQPKLMHLRGSERGPDEFSVVPNKPLEMPKDMASLPAPRPGGSNLVDPTPEADAVAALGGNIARGVPGDPGLMAQVTRFGVDPSIRQTLAQEDLDYRRKHDGRLLERWFNVTVYYNAYSRQSLDQYAELERWRARGVRNVSAPPKD